MSQVGGPRWYGYPPRPWPPRAGGLERSAASRSLQRATADRRYFGSLLTLDASRVAPAGGMPLLASVAWSLPLVVGLFVVPAWSRSLWARAGRVWTTEGSPLVFLLGNLLAGGADPVRDARALGGAPAPARLAVARWSDGSGGRGWRRASVLAFVVVLVTLVVSFFVPATDATAGSRSCVAGRRRSWPWRW